MVIGIDPGPRESAYVVWDGVRVVECGDVPNDRLAGAIRPHWINGVGVACEWIESFGMAVGREVFETVFTVGQLAAIVPGVRLVPRRDVKLHICKSAKAKDGNIRQALIDRFGEVGTKKNPGPLAGIASHRWAALAVAVTAFDVPHTDHEATFHRAGKASSVAPNRKAAG
jgi:hypothetical protein